MRLTILDCPERFLCFKCLINPPDTDTYSLGKKLVLGKNYKNEKVIQFMFHRIEHSFGVSIEEGIWGETQQ